MAVTDDGRTLVTSADWSGWLDRPVRLEAAGDTGGTFENPMDAENDTDWIQWQGPPGAWHDSGRSRLSIVGVDTLGEWDFRRFRANILVDGSSEDALVGSEVTVGSVRATVRGGIDRCVMVTRPQPGLDRDLQVLRTINRDRGSMLCVGATVDEGGTVAVGDTIDPVE